MILKGFKKLNEATSPELLGEDELTKLEDCILDEELGKPQKRGGWAKYNTNQVDTTSNVSSLHEVVAEGGNKYLLAGINGKLRKSLAGTGTWDDVTSKGTPPYRMQAYADNFIFTDGNVAPFIVSGATLGTITDLEIESPDVILGADGTNGVQSGLYGSGSGSARFYKYIIIYVTEDGNKSVPSYPISVYMTTTATEVALTNLPISTDSRVTQRYIYRTKENEESYYFHSQIDNIVTELVDNIADADLGSETFSFVNMPQTAEYITLHKERIILGNLTRLEKNYIAPAWSKTAAFTVNGRSYTDSAIGFQNLSATVTASSLVLGSYQYRVVFYDSEGLMSDYVDSNVVSVPTSFTHVIQLSFKIPGMANGYNVIKSAGLYRSFQGGNFELLQTYDPRRTTGLFFTDISYDTGSISQTTPFTSNQRIETEKCGLAFSDVGTPSVFNLEDIRNIFPDDGDEITGIYDDQDGILIFKKRSVCKVYTNGAPDNWRLVKVVTDIGCDEPNSLLKYGNDYAFGHNEEIYTYNSGKGYNNIGTDIWDTLGTVTSYHCAIADDGWFMFGVTATGLTRGYGFLVYDYNVKSWYLFNTTSIPYVAHIKEQGSDAGTIITSNATYLLKYGTGTVDTDTGSNVDIVPIIRTKTFGDGITLSRLRNLRFNYKKQDDKTCTITIVNPDTAVTNTHADTTNSTNSSDFKLYEDVTGKATDLLKETDKFYINITGAGFIEFGSLDLTLRPIRRGRIG